jgi:hypothetical protein
MCQAFVDLPQTVETKLVLLLARNNFHILCVCMDTIVLDDHLDYHSNLFFALEIL